MSITNAVIRKGYWYNNTFFPECQKFNQYNTFNTKVINLGSSSAVAAFDYDGLNIRGANFALSRNPLVGDWGILMNYLSYLKEGESTVIVTLCPFSSLSGSYDYLDDRYYRILYPTVIPNYSYTHYMRVRERMDNPIMYYPFYAPFVDLYKLIFKNKKDKVLSESQLAADADQRYKSWLDEFSISDMSEPLSLRNKDSIEDAIEIINKIVLLCREHDFKVYIVIPPVYKTLGAKFNEDVCSMLIDPLINNLIDNNVPFYNYMNDSEISGNNALFKSSFLMNKKGAKQFTRKLLKDINLI